MRENPMFSGISRLHLMDQAKERVKYTKEKHDQVPRRHKESAERKTSELVGFRREIEEQYPDKFPVK